MKKDIHPQYYPKAKGTCACGNAFTLGSTQATLQVEVCSNCHPFYTGQDKVMDKVGRIQKFKARLAQKQTTPRKTPAQRARLAPKERQGKQAKGNARITTKKKG